jgi:dTDP-4-amino-4,6-dideoxygalactose transaminase
MRTILDVARAHRLIVIEDAAQAIGAEFDGRRCGSAGEYGCFSFFPSKNLGAGGDAGMVVTNDKERAEKLAILRAHGSKPKYYHRVVGGNFRLDALQAAIVSAKLTHLDGWTEARRSNAARYNRLFADSGLNVCDSREWTKGGKQSGRMPDAVLPAMPADRHVFNQYVIRVAARDELRAALQTKGIGTEIYYPVPMHMQECFASLGYREGDFKESEGAAAQTLALPIYPELTDEQACYVVDSIRQFYGRPD